jgi:hypothetical protein
MDTDKRPQGDNSQSNDGELCNNEFNTDYTDVPISNIANLNDARFQIRDTLKRQTVQRYAQAMRAFEGYGEFPPVKLAEWRGDFYIVDGFHRTAAALTINLHSIPAKITKVNTEDAVAWLAAEANLTHGLSLNSKGRHEVFSVYMRTKRYLTKQGRPKALREISAELKGTVDKNTVSRWINKDYPRLKHLWTAKSKHAWQGVDSSKPKVKCKNDTNIMNIINADLAHFKALLKDLKNHNDKALVLNQIATLHREALKSYKQEEREQLKKARKKNLGNTLGVTKGLPFLTCEPSDF